MVNSWYLLCYPEEGDSRGEGGVLLGASRLKGKQGDFQGGGIRNIQKALYTTHSASVYGLHSARANSGYRLSEVTCRHFQKQSVESNGIDGNVTLRHFDQVKLTFIGPH